MTRVTCSDKRYDQAGAEPAHLPLNYPNRPFKLFQTLSGDLDESR